ncbi:FlgB family protein [Oceaniglobus roseus]|uniref:FlgB family protein n=1 Tax=Oceaniglobus roseus TaxID=1737570 RepID=UPI000C7F373C|nr:FlgB family protein [Kandeliimicrobium roseum]
MFDNIAILKTAGALAGHASQRQALTARNVANADTPGYRAMDLPDFAETYRAASGGLAMRRTRPAHLGSFLGADGTPRPVESGAEAAPNGNTVSLEKEMIRAVSLRHEHDLALSVFSKARDILRLSLGKSR